MSENQKPLLTIKNLCISTNDKTAAGQELLKAFDLELTAGLQKVISAPTGSGKTTLLNYIAGILPDEAFVITGEMQKAEGLKVSYAFQEPRLIAQIDVLKNVMLPLENITDKKAAQELALYWLKKLNLEQKVKLHPSKLSGGEQQRAGLARAFAYSSALGDSPCILLLDEPFASQDQANAQNIKNIINEQTNKPNRAAIIISHIR